MNVERLFLLTALSAMVAACGGGGSNAAGAVQAPAPAPASPTPPPAATVPAGTTQDSPTYAPDSVEAAILARVNDYRAQCGFPRLVQNTILDAASKAHTNYMQLNGYQVTDTEAVGQSGFTGITANDRAQAKGWPTGLFVATQNAGAIAPLSTDAEYGALIANVWATGVYHQTAVTWLANLVGVGSSTGVYGGYKTVLAGLVFSADGRGSDKLPAGEVPLTFPCAGVTGIRSYGAGESPMPPIYETVQTVGGAIQRWGSPVTVEANASDVVHLTSATYTAPDSTVIQLNQVSVTSDPAKLMTANKVVAYPTNALASNTTYTVDLAGTVNGAAFTRRFTFTTGT